MSGPRPRPRLNRFAARITLSRAVAAIVTLSVLFVLAAALVERVVEPHTFRTFGSACWWAVQTVSTVGYGDDVPVTTAGRVVASAVMVFGLAFVPAVTSIVVATLLEQQRRRHGPPD